MVHLLPDLGPGGGFVRQGVGRIAELVDVGRAVLGSDAFGHVLIIVRVALADVGAGEAHLGPQGAQMKDLLLRHLVGHHDDQTVALLGRDQGQAEAGVAGGRLDQGTAWLEAAIALRRFDHRTADSVLDRAPGILGLKLEEELARPCIDAVYPDERRVADHLQAIAVDRCGAVRCGGAHGDDGL